MRRDKDPMGAAIAEYFSTGTAGRLRVLSPDFDEDLIPVETLFRSFDDMPQIERRALEMARGRILDVGAGAGCHSLALKAMSLEQSGDAVSRIGSITSIDISPLSVETMVQRGVPDAREMNFWDLTADEGRFDTVLMMMNGIGIVGTLDKLPDYFRKIDSILADGGQVLLDSSDLSYLYEGEDLPEDYYGHIRYQMKYRKVKGEPFSWLYIDFGTLERIASENGFRAELVLEGPHYDYLAKLTK